MFSTYCLHLIHTLKFLRQIPVLLLFAGIFLLPAISGAQQMDPVEISRKLQNTYENAQNLVADFNQATSMRFSNRVRHGSGSLIFLRPGKIRWDYNQPDHQIIISDGESISMYFEKNSQMIISSAKEYLQSDVTYAFITGTGNIEKDFNITEPDFENLSKGTLLIKLIPKSTHPHVSYIHVWITDNDYLLEHLQIVDHFDTVTDLYFKNVQIDSDSYGESKISNDLFSFTPPVNTEIIRQY